MFGSSFLDKWAVSLRARSPRPVRTFDNDICRAGFPAEILALSGSPLTLFYGPGGRAARAPRCVGSSRSRVPRADLSWVNPSSEPGTSWGRERGEGPAGVPSVPLPPVSTPRDPLPRARSLRGLPLASSSPVSHDRRSAPLPGRFIIPGVGGVSRFL